MLGKILFLALSFSFGITVAAPFKIDEAWIPESDPTIMGISIENRMQVLPLQGEVTSKKRYWSGDYWALRYGSINYRWYAPRKIGFSLNSPTKEEARRMSIPQLAQLAPSEKFDLFTGRYDYPLRRYVETIADPRAQIWEGMCHGWAPATMNHNEPLAKLMTNPDGIEIPFGSTDIKALLSFYYAYQYQAPDTFQVGRRCFKGPRRNNDRDCNEDLNAGAFHLILANRLGLEGKGFVADLQRYQEVWNNPVTGYQSEVIKRGPPKRDSAPGTTEVLSIRTQITYLDDNGHDWQPVIGTKKQASKKLNYTYELDLNSQNEIIGGKWISNERPDFLWVMYRPRKFEGMMARLEELLDD